MLDQFGAGGPREIPKVEGTVIEEIVLPFQEGLGEKENKKHVKKIETVVRGLLALVKDEDFVVEDDDVRNHYQIKKGDGNGNALLVGFTRENGEINKDFWAVCNSEGQFIARSENGNDWEVEGKDTGGRWNGRSWDPVKKTEIDFQIAKDLNKKSELIVLPMDERLPEADKKERAKKIEAVVKGLLENSKGKLPMSPRESKNFKDAEGNQLYVTNERENKDHVSFFTVYNIKEEPIAYSEGGNDWSFDFRDSLSREFATHNWKGFKKDKKVDFRID